MATNFFPVRAAKMLVKAKGQTAQLTKLNEHHWTYFTHCKNSKWVTLLVVVRSGISSRCPIWGIVILERFGPPVPRRVLQSDE